MTSMPRCAAILFGLGLFLFWAAKIFKINFTSFNIIMIRLRRCILSIIVFCSMFFTANTVRCYQCSSAQEPKGQDSCGAYNSFEKDKHIPVECNSDESHTPGSFCMKVVQQGPLGFVWDGRWRQVIRRCASVAETGVSGVCNWGIYENGVYWEECYCAEDGCNKSHSIQANVLLLGLFVLIMYLHQR